MSFGLCNAPANFSTVVNLILKGLHLTVEVALIDIVLALDQGFDSHICYFVKVFQRFRENGIKLKREKNCYHLRPEEEYLGKTVGRKRVKISFIDTMDM